MPITRADILHYWDAAYGIAPLVGGDPTFARDGAGSFTDRQGLVRSAIARLPRFEWASVGGVTRPVWLGEMGATNLVLSSDDFTHTSWANGGGGPVLTANAAAAPDGTVTATRLEDNSTAAHLSKNLSFAVANDSQARTFSIFVRKARSTEEAAVFGVNMSYSGGTTSTGSINLRLNTLTGIITGLNSRAEDWGEYWRCLCTLANNATGHTTLSVQIFPATRLLSGGGDTPTATGYVFAWRAQLELGSVATTPIRTAGSTVSRLADSLSHGYAHAPQEQTVYGRFREGGTVKASGSRLFALGGTTTPLLFVFGTGTRYEVRLQTAGGSTARNSNTLPEIGDTVEVRVALAASGAVTLGVSINGAAEVVEAPTAALALPAAWNAPTLWINSVGTSAVGRNRFAEVKVVKGAPTLTELRDLVLSPAGDLI